MEDLFKYDFTTNLADCIGFREIENVVSHLPNAGSIVVYLELCLNKQIMDACKFAFKMEVREKK